MGCAEWRRAAGCGRARTKAQRMTKSIEETCTSLDDPKSSAYSAAARSKVREGGVNGMGQGPIRSTRTCARQVLADAEEAADEDEREENEGDAVESRLDQVAARTEGGDLDVRACAVGRLRCTE